jgi:hypothetical protein
MVYGSILLLFRKDMLNRYLQINFSENVHGENTPPMCAIFYYEPTAN